jgi:predicted porin/outer membrane murein-binding lipoprotein Lpp
MLRSLVVLLTATLVLFGYPVAGVAQQSNQSLQDRMGDLQKQIDQLNQQLKQMREEQAKTQQQASAAVQQTTATQKKVDSADKAWSTFIKGFFGTLDVSIDETTKGMSDMVAYHWGSAANGGPPYVNNGAKSPPGPFGRVSWMSMMSSNGSNIGYRGSHKIGTSDFDFIYQVSTAIDMAAAPGLQNTWTKSSNTVQGAIGLGDTWVGLRNKDWGQIKFGEMYTPYKTSTDRLNPFTGMLGNYSVVMGNTGGDNRIEFGTRMDHVVAYSSPSWSGFSFDASYSFGQNPDPYNNLTPLGSPDCAGANNPGSGNLFLNCDDGGFNYSYGGDLKFETGGLYLVAAYELHSQVNRSSDGIGSNNPFYNALPGVPDLCTAPNPSPLLDCGTYLAQAAEFPGAAAVSTPPYNPAFDTADEWAMKIGGQYHFAFGLTVSYLWEEMHRNVPAALQFQNERQRTGDWLALEYEFNGGVDKIAAGWAHAGATPGDPGGQHNYYPGGIGNNQSNMYTFAYWHKFDKQLTWYFDVADTANDGNAHYDIGAGGHGIKTDCHDATHTPFIDYTSAGPTTWGGCHEIGLSTGLNFKF